MDVVTACVTSRQRISRSCLNEMDAASSPSSRLTSFLSPSLQFDVGMSSSSHPLVFFGSREDAHRGGLGTVACVRMCDRVIDGNKYSYAQCLPWLILALASAEDPSPGTDEINAYLASQPAYPTSACRLRR